MQRQLVLAVAALWFGFTANPALAAIPAASEASGPANARAPQRALNASEDVCGRATPAVWPSSPIARRQQIERMSLLVRQCMEAPDVLAVLGALYLEDGDPAQALIWLERALLLDPGNLGAQADHALALAELGEPAALRELGQLWKLRGDIPEGLRAKLFPSPSRLAYALPAARFGQPERQTFGMQGDISALAGYEDNLDRSPRLSELTLSIPDGPFVLPVTSQPRKGRATLTSASAQLAYSPAPESVLRTGVQLNARRATAQQSTDWHQAQWSGEWVQRGSWWRAQADMSLAWVGGPLNEPYRMSRSGLSLEATLGACGVRVAYVREARTQQSTTSLDAESRIRLGTLQCPLPFAPTWNASFAVHAGEDRPRSLDRPGGLQRLSARVFRLSGALPGDMAVDFTHRINDVRDAEGYSILLESNAIRRLTLRQTSVELSQSLKRWGWPSMTATLQWQAARQVSNLKLFAYRADTAYGGIRWAW